MKESGLLRKWMQTYFQHDFHKSVLIKDISPKQKNKFVFTMKDSKIAFGPFIMGILTSILIAIYEMKNYINFRNIIYKINNFQI